MRQPLLSIGILLGDNCHPSRLKRCLNSLSALRAAVPCEVVAGDLGASQAVRAAARRADRIVQLDWNGDISASRNALLERCEGEFFLAMSPNEWLDQDISELLEFLQDHGGTDGAYFIQRSHKNDGSAPKEIPQLRLIRCASGARYEGALHETLNRALRLERCTRLRRTYLHYEGRFYREGFKDAMLPPNVLMALEREVNQKTQDLQTLNFYVEICGDVNIRLRCMQTALRRIQWGEIDPQDKYYAASLIRHGIRLTTELGKAEKWLEAGLALCPDSLFLGLDGHAYVMDLYYRLGKYDRVVECGDQYLSARKRLLEKRYAPEELAVSSLRTSQPAAEASLFAELGDSLCRLERWADAGKTLQCLTDLRVLPDSFWMIYAKSLLHYGEQLENGKILLARLWESAQSSVARWNWLQETTNDLFRDGARHPELEAMLATLINSAPCAAYVLQTTDAAQATAQLEAVTDWRGVLLAVYPHIMRLGAALPASFYQQKADTLADIAAKLPQYDAQFTQTVIAYGMVFVPETPAQLTWLLYLTAVALRVGAPADVETMEALCRQFQWVAAEYLHNIYNPALLNEQDISVLPGLHAFAWFFLQAQDASAQGNGREAVRLLRKGLQRTPGMKRAVDFQVRRMQTALDFGAESPELLALAEQVHSRLAQMRGNGEPGLDTLLNSPAYQQFKPLLDKLDIVSPFPQ